MCAEILWELQYWNGGELREGEVVYVVSVDVVQDTLSLVEKEKVPKFGVALHDTQSNVIQYAAYEPIWGSCVPDCGPLSMRLEAQMGNSEFAGFSVHLSVFG